MTKKINKVQVCEDVNSITNLGNSQGLIGIINSQSSGSQINRCTKLINKKFIIVGTFS